MSKCSFNQYNVCLTHRNTEGCLFALSALCSVAAANLQARLDANTAIIRAMVILGNSREVRIEDLEHEVGSLKEKLRRVVGYVNSAWQEVE